MNNVFCFLAILVLFTLSSKPYAEVGDEPGLSFYGSLRLGAQHVYAGPQYDLLDGKNYLSRLGVKAVTKLSAHSFGTARIEYGVNDKGYDPAIRQMTIGAKTTWGELNYGTQTLIWHRFVRSSYFSDYSDTLRQGAIRDKYLLQFTRQEKKYAIAVGTQLENKHDESFEIFQLAGEYKANNWKTQVAYLSDNRGIHRGNLLGARIWWELNDTLTFSGYLHHASESFDLYSGSTSGNISVKINGQEPKIKGVIACSDEERLSTGFYAKHTWPNNFVHLRVARDHCELSGDVDSFKTEYVHLFNSGYRVWFAVEALNNDEARLPETQKSLSIYQIGFRMDIKR